MNLKNLLMSRLKAMFFFFFFWGGGCHFSSCHFSKKKCLQTNVSCPSGYENSWCLLMIHDAIPLLVCFFCFSDFRGKFNCAGMQAKQHVYHCVLIEQLKHHHPPSQTSTNIIKLLKNTHTHIPIQGASNSSSAPLR